jgi:hypothetical protein
MRRHFPIEKQPSSQQNLVWAVGAAGGVCCLIFLFLATTAAALSQKGSEETQAIKPSQTPSLAEKKSEPAPNLALIRADFLENLSQTLLKKGVQNTWNGKSGSLRISAQSLPFAVGDAHLDAKALATADTVAHVLQQALSCLSTSKKTPPVTQIFLKDPTPTACAESPLSAIPSAFECKPSYNQIALEAVLVEGHADGRPYKDLGKAHRDNLDLSTARAESLVRRFGTCQPSLFAFANPEGATLLGAAGFSNLRLQEPKTPQHFSNRRVNLRFILR